MREISVKEIENTVSRLFIFANKRLPEDLCDCLSCARSAEKNSRAQSILDDLAENIRAADELDIPVCQDTGMAVVFMEVGTDVHIAGGNFEDAVNRGVAKGYNEGYLRKSIVSDPFRRVNTGDNTPAVIHLRLVDGDRIKVTAAPKGFGSENMSKLKMFTPSATVGQVEDYVVEVVKAAGSNPCPPMVIGVGIGGDFEYCALLSKKALCRPVSEKNADPFYGDMEKRILEKVNALDIGPQGFGGNTTALNVAIEAAPTHIAGLPVAVNIGCHVTRHASAVI